MIYRNGIGRSRPWCLAVLALVGLLLLGRTVVAQTTQPAAGAPAAVPGAAAPTTAPAEIKPDPTGAAGAGNSLLTPNAYNGWPVGTTDPKTGVFTPKATGLTPDEQVQATVRPYHSINMTWTLVCGFLVMFMQAGFALVETGLVRGK